MPPLETLDRHQKALLWRSIGIDSYGEPTVANTPEEIDVRWTYTRGEVRDPLGNVISIDAKAVVNQEISVHSILYLGEESDWYGTGSNNDLVELMRVVKYQTATDLKHRHTRRLILLQRYMGSLPERV